MGTGRSFLVMVASMLSACSSEAGFDPERSGACLEDRFRGSPTRLPLETYEPVEIGTEAVLSFDVRTGESRRLEPMDLAPLQGFTGSHDASPPTSFRRVFAHDSRRPVEDTTVAPWNQVSLFFTKRPPRLETCTGFFVGPRHVLTAGHCVFRRDAEQWPRDRTEVEIAPGVTGLGEGPVAAEPDELFGRFDVETYYVSEEWVRSTSNDDDWALLVLAEDDLCFGWMGLEAPSRSELAEERLFTTGYPTSGHCGHSPLESGECGFYQYTTSCEVEHVYRKSIRHKCDAYTGQSGSPMFTFRNEEPRVHAIHKGKLDRNDDNFAVRITPPRASLICELISQHPTAHAHPCY